ncbi:MAG TPA: GH32 C-terminal domain-containing protein, partial [Nocardioidaceae bacterium]|nr:GH32 C-terminal domain-containing protein [Nocardioidaceae bacterium]
PASTWRGAMTLPRDLSLRPGPEGRPVLVQRPAPELETHAGPPTTVRATTGIRSSRAPLSEAPQAYELVVRAPAGASPWTVEVHRDETLGRATRVSCDASDPGRPVLTVRRDDRGLAGVDPPGGQVVVLPDVDPDDVVEVRVLVDTCSVEVFAAGGTVVLTNLVFPGPDARGVAVTSGDATVDVEVTLRDLTTR